MGGIGTLYASLGFEFLFSSNGTSVEEGKVDEELNLADAEELSY